MTPSDDTERRRMRPREAAVIALPNGFTLANLFFGIFGIVAASRGDFEAAARFIVFGGIADALDGALARREGPTDRGAFIDICLDFFFYGTVPLAFALANPAENALPACLLLLGFIGTGSSFLAFASLAAKRGLEAQNFPKKGIYYLGGLTEGAETIAFFTLIQEKGAVFTIQAVYLSTPAAVIIALAFYGGADVWLFVALAVLMGALYLNNTGSAAKPKSA